jgi:uncharacterized membrane protein HdeD (DUF308 family)
MTEHPTRHREPAHVQSLLTPHPRPWRWLMCDGALGIVFGVIALAFPSVTALALGVLLGIGLVLQGAFELTAGLTAVPGKAGRTGLIVAGGLVLAAGLICMLRPGAGVFAITLGLALWFAISGVADLILAALGSEDRIYNAVIGTVSVAAAGVLLFDGNAAIATIALVAGLSFVLRGLLALYLGWRLHAMSGA